MSDIKACYFSNENGLTHCVLCPHNCHIEEGKKGICGVRYRKDGCLFTESYGRISSLALDPIEKKPLYHFFPGSSILSVGSVGCNFCCSFCQNFQIAKEKPETVYISPENLIYKAYELKASKNIGLAYTYNEPLINFEFVLDCCKLAKTKGLKNVLVTNGYIQQKPLKEILQFVDAMNIDLKSYNDDFYRKICGGEVEYVKQTIETAATSCHVEITSLIIPGLNDTSKEIDALASWLAGLSPEIPLHLSRFFPRYKMSEKEPTPKETLEILAERAKKHLKYVYIGNI